VVTERRQLLRLELAVGALAATVLLTMLVVGVDALRFHRATLGQPLMSPSGAALSLVLVFECLTAAVMLASLLRQSYRQRSFRRRLRATPRQLHGVSVLVVASHRPVAFCIGLLRPSIVVSDRLLELLSDRELLSVIAHERHHARRRDPLRRALAQAMSDALWFIPALRRTAATQMTISELAADAEAARSAGAQPLASALVAFEDHGGPGAGASPERVSQLVGERLPRRIGACSTFVAGTILLALIGGVVYLLRPVPAELCLPLSTALGAPLAVLVLALACVPAGLVGRNAARVVRTSSTELA